MEKYISLDALVTEIKRLIKHSEMVADHNTQITELVSRELDALYHLISFLDTIEVKGVDDVWHDARKTLPEDGIEQIICIKEDGLAVSTVGKIVNGTMKWAYLSDLLNINSFNIEVKDANEALRTEYELGRHNVIAETLKWPWDLNQEHEIMSYTDSHVLDSEELQQYYKNNIEE